MGLLIQNDRQPTPSTFVRLAVVVGAGLGIMLGASAGANADPSIRDRQAQAQAVLAEVQGLDEEVAAAAERWNGANLELDSLTNELRQTRADLAHARRLYRTSQQRIATRLRTLYVNGAPDSTLEVILGARSLDEVIAGLEATQRVAAQDAQIGREAAALRRRVAKREVELSEERAGQAAIVDRLSAEKRAIEGRLADRQRLLASVRDEVARMQEAERRRQAELRHQAELELERQRRAAEALAREAAEQSDSPSDAVPDDDDRSSPPAPVAPGSIPPPADASMGARVVAIALQYLGVPYKWGGASPETGFDCSGLTMYVYAQVGISLPHLAAAQYRMGVPVPRSQLQPGDLVFFNRLTHMGMYIGAENFIHAPRTGDVVKISPLSDPYYVANWVGAKRVL